MRHLFFLSLFSCTVLLAACNKNDDDGTVIPEETAQSKLEGYWYTAHGTKYTFTGNTVTGTQALAADHYIVIYHNDSTFYHDGTGASIPYEISSDGAKLTYRKGTGTENYYQVEKLTTDSLVVYGPFAPNGDKYDASSLYRLRHYRK